MAKKKQDLTPEERIAAALVPEEEWPYALPDGWKWVYWGKCGDFIAGTGFPKLYQGIIGEKYPFYKVGSLRSIDADGYLMDNQHSIDDKILLKIKAKKIEPNSIVFAKIGEAIKLNRRGLTKQVCCVDNNMMAFQADKNLLDYHYVYYWSTGIDLYKYTNATTVPAIRKTDLEKIVFPLPPLSEQYRIVARIKSLFTKLDAAKEKVQSVLDSHETRKAALLHDAFAGKLTAKWREEHQTELRESKQFPSKLKSAPNHVDALAGKWALVRLGDVITWSSGGTPSRKHPEYYSGDIPWVKTGELNNTYIYDTSEKITKEAIAQSSAKVLPVNTVLLAMYGATIGKVGILGVEAATNQACACGICSEWVDYRFLFYYLQSQKSSFICSGKGGAQPNISQTIIKQYEFPLPSLPEQQEIVRILGRLLAREQRARQAAEETLAAIDRMKQSILARAFRGEL